MPIDSSIYNLIQQPKIQGPMEQFGGAMQIRNLVGQGQLQDLQRGELEAGLKRTQQLRDLFSGGGKVTPDQVMAIDPEKGLAFRKSELESRKLEADTSAKQAAALKDKLDIFRSALQPVGEQMSYSAWRANLIMDLPQFADTVPEQFTPEVKRDLLLKGDELAKALSPRIQVVNLGGRQQAIDVNPITNPSIKGTQWDMTMSPGDTARLGEAQGHNLEMERLAGARQYDETGVSVPPRQVTIGQPTVPAAAPQAPAQVTAAAPAVPAAQPVAAAPAPAGVSPKQARGLAADRAKRDEEVSRTLNMYVAARDGLMGGLGGSETGPLAGRIPPVTSAQQTAEGGVAAMAPALKQLFRVAGEGVFTDRDQQLLLDMVPKRTDTPEARVAKMANIDAIVAAKLGMPVPAYKPEGTVVEGKINSGQPKTFDALPDPSQFIGKRMRGPDNTIYKSDGKQWNRQ